jgi:hypothetical protein
MALAALAVGARVVGPLVFDMNGPMPRRLAAGFYEPERIHGNGVDLTFAWTSARADLKLAGLDRSRAWRCTVMLRGPRPGQEPSPQVMLTVDGLSAEPRATTSEFREYPVDIPSAPGRSGGQLSIATLSTFVPGPNDRRDLGVQIDRIACAPTDARLMPPPRSTARQAAFAGALFGAGVGLAGVPSVPAVAIAMLAGAAGVVPLEAGPAAYAGLPGTMVRLSALIAALLLVGFWGSDAVFRRPISAGTRGVVALAAALLYAQLLALFHPAKPLVDAVFHAHRFDGVLSGHYFFTQPMPGGVSFPYAIALYVFASPWAALTTNHVALLRVVVCASDLAAYLLLYWLIVRTWADRLIGGLAVVLCLSLPIVFDVIGNANLTNEFGHAASIAAMVLASVRPARRWRVPHALGLTLAATTGFLAHVSTIALLACTLVALAVAYWWRGGPEGRRHAWTLVAVTSLAAVLSVVVYYGHFGDVYAKALAARNAPVGVTATAGTVTATPLSLPQRVAEAGRLVVDCLGWPMLLLAAMGAWRVRRRPRGDACVLLIGACTAAFVVFVGVGLMRVNPQLQRYSAEFITRVVLATSPAAILLAAEGAVWALRGPTAARVSAAALVAWAMLGAGARWLAWFT